MTREEFFKQHVEPIIGSIDKSDMTDQIAGKFHVAFGLAGIAWEMATKEAAPRWRTMGEAPRNGQYVLIAVDEGYQVVSQWNDSVNGWTDGGNGWINPKYVMGWMPLPDAPDEY